MPSQFQLELSNLLDWNPPTLARVIPVRLLWSRRTTFLRVSYSPIICRKGGYEVVHAFDGEQAIQMARELKLYAITLNILLPKKNGLEVLAELKSLPETIDTPVVIVSITEDKQLGFSMGAFE